MDPTNPGNTTPQPVQPFSPAPTTPSPHSKRGWWVGASVVVILLLAVVGYFVLRQGKINNGVPSSSSVQASDQLFSALAHAASQPRIHVGMYRATYSNESNATASSNPSRVQSTVSELNNDTGDYRSVYAYRFEPSGAFNVGRCLSGGDYRNFGDSASQKPTTLQQASETLTTRLQKATGQLTYSTCASAGVFTGVSTDEAAARLSDGLFPVTLTSAQADTWKTKVTSANLFDVRDEGMITKDGKQLRKYTLDPKPGVQDSNQQLYQIFQDAADIARVKQNPKAVYQYEFISIGVANQGNIKGDYLIDPASNLPVYSELYGTGSADKSGQGSSTDWAHTKQNYTFPSNLSMSLMTGLDFLK